MSSSGICEYSPTGALVPYSKMDRNGSRLSISDIPRELISEIFLFFCTEFLPLSLPPQLLLTQICAYWRAVAHRTPRLWTQLSMNMRTGKFPHHTELITAWLKRSGSLPLDIKMMVAKGQGKRLKNPLKAVIPFIHRWRCFEVDSPLHILRPLLLLPKPSAPLLEHVCIHVRQVTERSLEWFKRDAQQRLAKNGAAFSCFLGAPRLYSLHAGVSHDSRRGGRSPLPLDTFIPYKQITHLTLGEFESVKESRKLLLVKQQVQSKAGRTHSGMRIETDERR
ncbi:hypothetical protein D9757_012049 [Collybiopsis confluens]|uniref:F-box domain-containing protein n=1 Tax=Collybiopsis confluens TaxID=2823264 RepID=A0A8H5D1G5_9AGAR|nr:hypothetical protein D9757_012049 [Collybiopsis confluens]